MVSIKCFRPRGNFAARLAVLACSLSVLGGGALPARAAENPEVLVLLWLDTEDYLLPASDDAAKRLADLLTSRKVRATFKVVGEKARTLERRGRKDVIEALAKHDIGYHSNLHSVHPTPAEYLADRGWADGVAEFARREGPGAADVRRIFGVPVLSCYGQPGSSWGPQTHGALSLIGCAPQGVPCYVDEGSHVGLGGRLFWFAGSLTLYHMAPNVTRMDLHAPRGLEEGRDAFRKIHERLRSEGGGVVSIYYHPCEWVHRTFWDGVNFSRGANPPREDWKPPPQRPAQETDAAFERFGEYIDFQKSLPGVRSITASDLPALFPDRVRKEGITLGAAVHLASRVSPEMGVGFLKDEDGLILSAADQFTALAALLAGAIEKGSLPGRVDVPAALGPTEPPCETEVESLPWPAFRDALLDARSELEKGGHIPSRVFAGDRRISPADFLAAMAVVLIDAASAGREGRQVFPEKVAVPRGTRVSTERHIAEDTPQLFGGWVIHREGFRAPRILEQARLQAWTLKPAS